MNNRDFEKRYIAARKRLIETEFAKLNPMQREGKITQTGKLGDVMKESIETAYSVVRAHSKELGINPEVFEKTDIHVHVPEGATPKDGPSAGIAMYTTLVSVLTKIPVRKDLSTSELLRTL